MDSKAEGRESEKGLAHCDSLVGSGTLLVLGASSDARRGPCTDGQGCTGPGGFSPRAFWALPGLGRSCTDVDRRPIGGARGPTLASMFAESRLHALVCERAQDYTTNRRLLKPLSLRVFSSVFV